MDKEDIAQFVFKHTKDIPYANVEKVIDEFLKAIIYHIIRKKDIELRGFGIFKPKYRTAKKGYNIHTKEVVEIPGRYIPSFTPSQLFKDTLLKCSQRWKIDVGKSKKKLKKPKDT